MRHLFKCCRGLPICLAEPNDFLGGINVPFRLSPLLAFCALVAVLAVAVSDADARAGRGGSFGSRGSQTFSAPPSTATSPSARPIERSMTQPGQPGSTFGQRAARPTCRRLVHRPGLLGGMVAGFLGAGLFGMLFGNGFMGGLGRLRLDARLDVADRGRRHRRANRVGMVATLAASRRSPAARCATQAAPPKGDGRATGSGGGSFSTTSATRASGSEPRSGSGRTITTRSRAPGRRAGRLQRARTRGLRQQVTPEMLSYYAEELAANTSQGVRQPSQRREAAPGDLAEA